MTLCYLARVHSHYEITGITPDLVRKEQSRGEWAVRRAAQASV